MPAQNTQQFVDDLIWAINSPLLADPTNLEWHHSIFEANIDKAHLANFVGEKFKSRVGHYFESLIAYWITCIWGCELIAHSHTIRVKKRTLGELDFIFRDARGCLNHWEVACKFYLQDDKSGEYIGPNSRDTLQAKISRMLKHQLPLGKASFPEVASQRAVIKGRMFYHWQNSLAPTPTIPLGIDHLRGVWLRASEVRDYFDNQNRSYKVLNKPFWLSEEYVSPDSLPTCSTQTAKALEAHFATDDRPLLLCEFSSNATAFREERRLFVVHDQWPR